MMMVLLAAVTSTVAVRTSLKNQYYNHLAQDAGEAGVAYAKACMKANSNAPTWTDAKPLKPNTDCSGNITYTCAEGSLDPKCSVVVVDSKTVTSFSVSRPIADSSGSFNSSYIVANGKVDLLRTDSTIWRSYSAPSTGQLVKRLKVTFDSQGGSAVSPQMTSFNSKVIAPTNPIKTGYTFGGWYKDIQCGCYNAWNFDTDIVTTNMVLYADWHSTTITAIAAITGTPQIGQTLTAGAVTPAGATVSYQWYSSATVGGTYDVIAGATASTYVVSPNVMGKYIKVVATGTGVYSGNQTSGATGQVPSDTTNWITIGTQTWAKANLNIGTRIAGASAQANNATTEKYCYNDTESNCTAYSGGLYQWDEAMGYSKTEGAQGICPAGTHVPTDSEWKTLEMSLSGMTQAVADTAGWRGTDEGTKLKSGGTSGLHMPLAGLRNTAGSFSNLSSYASLWSSSESGANAWYRDLLTSQANVLRNTYGKAFGLSVRCLGN